MHQLRLLVALHQLRALPRRGADKEYEEYEGTYGVKTKADELSLQFVTEGPYTTNVGSRLCMINGEDKHKMFHLKNREFTFTVMIPKWVVV